MRGITLSAVVAATLGSGCGLGKIADDFIDLGKAVARDPQTDARIVEVGGAIVAFAAWEGAHEISGGTVPGPNGERYFVTREPDGRALWVQRRGEVAERVLTDEAIDDLTVTGDRLEWRSGDARMELALPL